jgi:hypothetical protein
MTYKFAQVPGLHLESWVPAISLAETFMRQNPLSSTQKLLPQLPTNAEHPL